MLSHTSVFQYFSLAVKLPFLFVCLKTVDVSLADDSSDAAALENVSFECFTSIGIEMGSQTITTTCAELDGRWTPN